MAAVRAKDMLVAEYPVTVVIGSLLKTIKRQYIYWLI